MIQTNKNIVEYNLFCLIYAYVLAISISTVRLLYNLIYNDIFISRRTQHGYHCVSSVSF